MSVVISLLTFILFKIISIVSSNGTFVNNHATSNDTILYLSGTFCFWMYLTNSLVLLIVNSDLLNGANKLVKYFAVSYVAVKIVYYIFSRFGLGQLIYTMCSYISFYYVSIL